MGQRARGGRPRVGQRVHVLDPDKLSRYLARLGWDRGWYLESWDVSTARRASGLTRFGLSGSGHDAPCSATGVYFMNSS